MAAGAPYRDDVSLPYIEDQQTRHSLSESSVSSMSAILEEISTTTNDYANGHSDSYQTKVPLMHDEEEESEEGGVQTYDAEKMYRYKEQGVSKTTRRVIWVMSAFALGGWLLALFLFLRNGTFTHVANVPFEHHSDSENAGTKSSTGSGSGRQLTLESVGSGEWYGRKEDVSWIASPDGKDGMILEIGGSNGRGQVVVEDVLARKDGDGSAGRITLVKSSNFRVDGRYILADSYWPSPNLKKVLILSEKEKNFRHSFTGLYWIVDVNTQTAEPLDPEFPSERVQLAQWSPKSDSIVFTRNNNLFIRDLNSKQVTQITTDGGSEFFYGIPDWVYEEEVFGDRVGTWFSHDGRYVAFLQTNETEVPEYPVQYFLSRPSGSEPILGEESYPDELKLKYPKAGAPNPVVKLKIYDIKVNRVADVKVENDFPDNDRLITEVIWDEGDRVLIRETNRVSDALKMVVMNANNASGRVIREIDAASGDGCWFEVSQSTKFIPSDPQKGRPHSGYIDTIAHNGYDHLAYFTPLDNPEPKMLTSGDWEVVEAPSAVDLANNLVYFVATKQGAATRHVYSVKLDGSDMQPLPGIDEKTDTYWEVFFSSGAGFALLNNRGPGIPSQKIISTPSNNKIPDFSLELETNEELSKKAAAYDLPTRSFTTVQSDGVEIPVLELRPSHFDESKKYPVVLAPYGGPGSQSVSKTWAVNFESYLAAALGYIVLVPDGRGTGFKGRDYRCVVRGNLGAYEAADQIAVAKEWARKPFVDSDRIAIWGWSFGGFLTLKTLELDGHETFSYGMAVAPVTDWRFYDSVYTERYMDTPQKNRAGYDQSTITNVTGLALNVRFLMMHGVGDDNVHFQNSMALLDRLDLAGVTNYDFHAFPDSDHSIYFHNAHAVVYKKLNDWLINAFNGEWHKIINPQPSSNVDLSRLRRRSD